MSEWKSFSLGDVCNFSKDKIEVSKLDLGNYISTENLLPNKGGITEAASLPKVSATTSFDVGDILISNIRPYFKKIWCATFSGGCSNDVLAIRAKKNIEPKFLYYVLSEDKFFDLVTATAKGTKMPRGDKQVIINYPLPDFPLKTQKKIASVLSAFDDKIELKNHSIDLTKISYIDEETHNILKRSIIKEEDILFTIAGTLGRFAFVDKSVLPANTNQAVAIIRADERKVNPKYVYSFFMSDWHVNHYQKRIQQSVQANLSLSTIKSLCIPMLPDEQMKGYIELIEPIISMINSTQLENQKIDVSEVEI